MSGGRGVYVDFTYCPPGIVNETQCEIFNRNNKNPTYVFSHNTIVANTASLVTKWRHTPLQYRAQKTKFQGVGIGGGLTFYIRADASNNSITVEHCSFLANKAILGGGLLVNFHYTAKNNLGQKRAVVV